MKYDLKEYCHPIFEVIQIISRYVNHESYKELCEGFSKKQRNMEMNSKMYEHLQDFMESVIRESHLENERLDFFFKEDSHKDKFSYVDLLSMIYCDFSIEDLDELNTHVFTCYEQKGMNGLCQQIAFCFDREGNHSELDHMKQDQFIKFLDEQKLSIEEKYKVLEVLLDFHKLRMELNEILKKVFVVYHEKKQELDGYLNEFLEYWKDRLSEDTFEFYLKKTFNLQLDEIEDVITIYPTVMGINMGIFNDMRDRKSSIIMFWGISFIRNFNVDTILVNKESLLEELKVFSDPSKFDILMFIRNKAAYGQEIAKELNLTTATISHHMQALVNARVVNIEKQQNRVYYSMNRKNVEQLLKEIKSLLLNDE